MRIFVAGATGALGRRLVPLLVHEGHEVTGMTRTTAKRSLLEELGAEPVVADALDREAVTDAIRAARPDAVVHQLTALSGGVDPRRLDRDFALTNRLRTEGTDHLLAAARAVGARRIVAQSFTGWPFARTGGPVKHEADPLDDDPPRGLRRTLAAIRYLEQAITGVGWDEAASVRVGEATTRDGHGCRRVDTIEGIVLRYGSFYGPGTGIGLDPPGEQVALLRRRRLPIIGGGSGVWSFIHVDDAARATVAAIERGRTGVYQIVDDEPAPVSQWLPVLAEAIGAPPPLRVPRWLGRMLGGEAVTMMMTEARGASNEKVKRELGWRPRFRTWRDGFREGLRAPNEDAGRRRAPTKTRAAAGVKR